jgi:hypothetical protein
MRRIFAACGLAHLLVGGVAAPAAAQWGAEPEGVEIDVADLMRDELEWRCDRGCNVENTNALRLEALARTDQIDRISTDGEVIYVHAAEGHEKLTFTYRAFDRALGASAPVRVTLWLGYRAPARDQLVAVNGTEDGSADADCTIDRGGTGDVIDLVRTPCPKDGHLFLREVDGTLIVLFQPDGDFTGATYFRYASADRTGSAYQPAAAAAMIPSLADENLSEGIVREQELASPS